MKVAGRMKMQENAEAECKKSGYFLTSRTMNITAPMNMRMFVRITTARYAK